MISHVLDAHLPTVSDKPKIHEEQDEKNYLFSINLFLQGGLLDSMGRAGFIHVAKDAH